ncbi:enoyl-CoA hydratase [Williamsia sp.]|uniref:enoyl-CoA hydratase n=1 Tax=Williamsia sp. TaxID=1872085 RepID=UPI001A273846|nr:enoyl-CoA hydratase [Williamsia sp.]MBJ7288062.1 enoyl-CoA hydratase [Williamsia sp.]
MIGSSRDGLVTTIEIRRENKRNALDHAVLDGLAAAVTDAVDTGSRAIVLTGQGAVFSAGADLSGPVYDPDFLATLVATLQQIESLPVPVIAALNGSALGAGLQLAMVADLRVMAPGATVGIPAAKLGVAVDEWTIRRLTSLVGGGIARGMLIGCDPLTADRAHAIGFANRIGDLAEAQAWAASIADLAPLTLAHYKLVFAGDGARDEAPADRMDAMMRAWDSDDLVEGRTARAEKRVPRFTGR